MTSVCVVYRLSTFPCLPVLSRFCACLFISIDNIASLIFFSLKRDLDPFRLNFPLILSISAHLSSHRCVCPPRIFVFVFPGLVLFVISELTVKR